MHALLLVQPGITRVGATWEPDRTDEMNVAFRRSSSQASALVLDHFDTLECVGLAHGRWVAS